jgi:RND superfamily putative drug exporter
MSIHKHVPAWLRIGLPSLIVIVWIALAGVGGPYFGKISEVSSTDLATFLPKSAESTKVNDQLTKFRSSQSVPLIVVFSNHDATLTDAQITALNTLPTKLAGTRGVNGKISPAVKSDDGKAAFIIVPLANGDKFKNIFPAVKADIAAAGITLDYKFAGAAAFANDLQGAFSGIDGTLLVVALAVVFIILLAVYRSVLLPIIVLFVAMSALATAIFIVYHLAKVGVVELNGQVQGILFILVIGAATDYSLLYIARYKEELFSFDSTWRATRAALKSSYEPILAAGGTVIVGLMCLLLSDLASNKALGPVGAIGIGLSVMAALSFLPALLLLFGRVSFWPRIPHHSSSKTPVNYEQQHKVWSKVGALVQRHPRRIWVGSVIILGAATFGLLQLKADGVPQSDLVLGYSEAREGQKVLDQHFPAGSGSPAYVIVDQSKVTAAVQALESTRGVDSVSAFASDSSGAAIPLGKSRAALQSKILDQIKASRDKQVAAITATITAQMLGAPSTAIDQAVVAATQHIPSAETLAQQAYPFKDAQPKVVDAKIALQATLKDAADSFEARQTIVGMRSAIKKVDSGALVGGVTAVQYDTNQAALHDQKLLIPVILIAITIILMILLRAIVAPIVLLFTTVLSFGATLGISAFLFNHLWHFPGADPSVVIFGFVFLVALGIDYNIFLMTRVREETVRLGVQKGTIKGLVVTGGVITSAGVVLASTFAALSVIPILFLAQIAFIVAFGVLLDTIIVRSLLVPSLTLELGKIIWWPARKKQ